MLDISCESSICQAIFSEKKKNEFIKSCDAIVFKGLVIVWFHFMAGISTVTCTAWFPLDLYDKKPA